MAACSVKNKNTEHLSQIQPRQCTLWLRTNKIIRNLSNKDKCSPYLNTCFNMLHNDDFID